MATRPQSDLANQSSLEATKAAQPDLASSMGGSRSSRQMQGQQLMAGATSTIAQDGSATAAAAPVIGPPLSLQYDASALKGVPGLHERIDEWERLHLKDGATLTVEERLVLVAHWLGLQGISAKRISHLIGAAFFGVLGNERDADNLTKNHINLVYATPGTAAVMDLRNPIPGTARVLFSNGSSSSFTGPTNYTGMDTNQREQTVGLAKNGYRVNGHRAGYGNQSMVPPRRAEFQGRFLADDMSKPVRNDPVSSPRYIAAFNDFIYDRVLNDYSERVAFACIPALQNWVDANPAPSPVTPAWGQQLGQQAMALVLGCNLGNIFARRHTTWYVEDEAAAQILVEQVQPGLKVNFDVDASTVRVG